MSDLSVPRYVLGALEAAQHVEHDIHSLLTRRQTALGALRAALMKWHAAQPEHSPRDLHSAIYAELRLEHGSTEYLRVAQMLSRAWRFDPEAPAAAPLPLPRAVNALVKSMNAKLDDLGWTVLGVVRKPHEIVVRLRPVEETELVHM